MDALKTVCLRLRAALCCAITASSGTPNLSDATRSIPNLEFYAGFANRWCRA